MAATFLYVGNADTNDISMFRLDPASGALTAIATIPIPDVSGVGPSSPMAISPDKRFMYVGNRFAPYQVAVFSIDPKTGALKHLGKGPLANTISYIVPDQTGRYLLSASYQGNMATVNPIMPDGMIGPIQQILSLPPSCHAILPSPDNRFVFVPSLGADVVNLLRFDERTGKLSFNDPPQVRVREKDGPRHFRFHPNGKYTYLINEHDATLCVFDYDAATGQWTEKQIVSLRKPGYTGLIWCSDLHITPDGRFIYGAERGANTLAGFKVDPQTGMLTQIGHFDTETQPRGFAIDHSSRYLYSSGQLSTHIIAYAIEPDGRLRPLRRYPVGENANWIEILDLPSAS